MPIFTYKGLDSTGKTVSGELDTAERRIAVQKLTAMGIKPIAITSRDAAIAPTGATIRGSSITSEDIQGEDFFKQKGGKSGGFSFIPRRKASGKSTALALQKQILMLLSAGFPLGDALRLLSVRLTDPTLKLLCTNFWKKLSEGSTLSAAFATAPELFDASTIHLIEAGEASGNLIPILERNVAFLEENIENRRRILSGLAYPVFVCFIALGVILAFGVFFLPIIQKMLKSLGGEPSLLVTVVVNSLRAFVYASPFLLVGGIVLTVGLVSYRKTTAGRALTDYWTLRLPALGRITLFSNIFQTSSLMSTLMASGVNTTETLRLVERTIGNVHLKAKFAAARKQIQEGVSMATAISRVKYMPDLAMDILTVGENTGSIVNSLREINKIYRAELTKTINFMTNTITFVALGSAFGFVALIAYIIVTSIFDVSKALQH
ncbi:MAG: type II secretion system F family protein [Verrucomicrobiota bacterium]|nr:type II secretion system F family protein [Verrucomicrobiota bacterium]